MPADAPSILAAVIATLVAVGGVLLAMAIVAMTKDGYSK